MNVLFGCERTGTCRREFERYGWDAYSCDLYGADDLAMMEKPSRHIKGDVYAAVKSRCWDLIVLFPPCTCLAVAGNGTWARSPERKAAVDWTIGLWHLACQQASKVGLENPISCLSSMWKPPTQIIQPWWFGHMETKKTCLWLHNLPPLEPMHIVHREMMELPLRERARIHHMSPGKNRSRERSKTYPGIAYAMADQWSHL